MTRRGAHAVRRLLRCIYREVAGERGETSLTGLLVASVLTVVVLGATLSTFEQFESGQRATEKRVEMQDRARRAIDHLASELRNLASPTSGQPDAFDVAGPFDIVFKTVASQSPSTGSNATNVMRVRYCLDARDPLAAVLVAQTQTWTTAVAPPVPSTASCPGEGWQRTETLVDGLAHRSAAGVRPVFTLDAATLTDISRVHVDLYVDADPSDAIRETSISTGVFLRNQNRRPVAQFTATASAQGIVLNGSTSFDPEGQPLRYEWYDGEQLVGTGITFTYAAPRATTRVLRLRVLDPADLDHTADPQEVAA